MPLILNIETATEICSVCISKGIEIVSLRETKEIHAHARVITLLIQQCLEQAGVVMADLDAVAVSQGPGSYTGLRVGSSAAKGICYGLHKPLIAIDTLRSLALATWQKERQDSLYCPMIDARRMEVYCAFYNKENMLVTKTHSQVIDEGTYENYFASEKKIIFSGNGAAKCKTVIKSPFASFSSIECSARHLVPLSLKTFLAGGFCDPAYFTPNYHKAPNITIPKNKDI